MTVITRHRRVGIAVLCTALLACGKSASDPSGATAAAADPSTPTGPAKAYPDPCSLLTIAEASAALGGPAKSVVGKATDRPMIPGLKVTEKLCGFELVTSSQSGYDIKIGVYEGADRNFFDQSGGHAPAIPDLGDAAKGTAREIFVFSKGTMLQLYGSLPNNEGSDALGFHKLARLAIAKL